MSIKLTFRIHRLLRRIHIICNKDKLSSLNNVRYKTVTTPGQGKKIFDVWIDKLREKQVQEEKQCEEREYKYDNSKQLFYNQFTANEPEIPRTWELENTGNRYSLGIFSDHPSCIHNNKNYIFSFILLQALPTRPSTTQGQ